MRKGIMLAQKINRHLIETKWPVPFFTQAKINGTRCRAICGVEKVTLLSSEENEIVSVPHINEALHQLQLDGMELDGELYKHGMSFQEIVSRVKRTKNIHQDSVSIQFWIFDIVADALPYKTRKESLETLKVHIQNAPDHINTSCLRVMKARACNSVDEIDQHLEELMRSNYEGIILRNPAGFYVRKKTSNLMKLKPRKILVAKVLGVVEECTVDGIPKGSLGALQCLTDRGIPFNVGSGPVLTRSQRLSLWRQRSYLVGRKATILYQELSDKGVPIFPILVEI